MNKKILIACGGTGGHLAPGIALAQRLIERGDDCRLLISAKQVDKRLSQKYPELTFESLPAVAFSKNPIKLLKFVWSQLHAILSCLKLMHRFKPDAVVGFGGFITVSAAVCAKLLHIPLLLHEANHRVGRTIRLLARLAHTIYVPIGIEPFPKLPNHHIKELALPLRKDLQKVSREQARKELGLPLRGRVLAVMGGSQGAAALNKWAVENEQTLLESGIHLYCIAGLGGVEPHTNEKNLPMGQSAKSIFVGFCDQMHLVYAAADLVVARAGASTINELIYCNTPSILIPFPHAADDHQRANARALERQAGAIVVDESQIDKLMEEVNYTLRSDTLLDALKDNLARIDMGHPADTIADAVENLHRTHSAAAALPHTLPPFPAQTQLCSLLKKQNIKLLLHEPLGPKTTFRIGGEAKAYAEPSNLKQLKALLCAADKLGINAFFLGRGSNLLVLDNGFDGLVICLKHPYWQRISRISPHRLEVGAGARLKTFCSQTAKYGISGFEFLEGIPASIGGACRMNAGALGHEFFERVEQIQLMDHQGRIYTRKPHQLKVGYRQVEGLGDGIILSVRLRGTQLRLPSKVRQQIEQNQLVRKQRQPRQPSAGCFFRNPPGHSAGALIEQVGLKGLRVNDAAISDLHANFIVNLGQAHAKDVIDLANQVRQKVALDTHILLEVEIMLLGGSWKDYLEDIRV